MKENKDYQVKVRITKREKEKINAYCEKHSLTISEFIRIAVNNQMNKGE